MATAATLVVPRYRNGTWQDIHDTVTPETPLTVSWQSQHQGTGKTDLWAWPHDLAPLALGHVLLDKVPTAHCLQRTARVEQTGEVCFHVQIDGDSPQELPTPPAVWKAEELLVAMHDFISAGGLWDDTGCFHRAGVFDLTQGTLLTRAEDIGRHNCVDRLAGWSVLQGIPLSRMALLISARMTSSLCAKALRAGFRILVSRSAVTTAAIAMAKEKDATLAGFARTDEGRFTVFADPQARIR